MNLQKKRVAIFGLGQSGRSALNYARFQGAMVSAIDRGPPEDWPPDLRSLLTSTPCLSDRAPETPAHLATQDLILLSPGIPRTHFALMPALKAGVPVWNESELAARNFPGPIVAVTGTNGKTTTATLIARALEQAGHSIFLGGNTASPFLNALSNPPEIAVLELSSFQLESMPAFHPRVALILNLSPSHGERYVTFQEYALAKANIARNMGSGNTLILGPLGPLERFPWPKGVTLVSLPKEIFLPFPFRKELGEHNRLNFWFATQALKALGTSLSPLEGLAQNFKPLPHRLERLPPSSSKSSLCVVNDAKSTNWEATFAAVKALHQPGKKLWLVCGGQRRGRHDTPSLFQIKELNGRVEKILAIGEAAELIASTFSKVEVFPGLEEAFGWARKRLEEGILVFSPAFPSFDQYKGYEERGEHFRKIAMQAP